MIFSWVSFTSKLMDIEFYESINGRKYVEKYLDKLPINTRKKIVKTLELIEEEGLSSLKQLGKFIKLRNKKVDLYELRFYINKIWYRIFCIIYNSKCWLLHIFDKKSNDTPERHIETAENRALEIMYKNY
ncbi:MAG: type II toxin-antitoxin system RelE/ParE family toxin [bacterium]|nr:type II toxin-antitoxin system RelE/ParE family toxin [bacterium]